MGTPSRPPLHTIAASLALLALVGCADVVRPAVSEIENLDAPDGRSLYRRLCASCHGVGGRGDGPIAGQLKVRLPDLTLLAKNNGGTFPRPDVTAILSGERPIPTHGPLSMPVWGQQLAPADSAAATAAALDRARDVTAITDYLASLQRP